MDTAKHVLRFKQLLPAVPASSPLYAELNEDAPGAQIPRQLLRRGRSGGADPRRLGRFQTGRTHHRQPDVRAVHGPASVDGDAPVVLIHGMTHTGKASREATPNSRLGWDEYFAPRRGHPVYVPDQLGHGPLFRLQPGNLQQRPGGGRIAGRVTSDVAVQRRGLLAGLPLRHEARSALSGRTISGRGAGGVVEAEHPRPEHGPPHAQPHLQGPVRSRDPGQGCRAGESFSVRGLPAGGGARQRRGNKRYGPGQPGVCPATYTDTADRDAGAASRSWSSTVTIWTPRLGSPASPGGLPTTAGGLRTRA